MSAFTPAPVSHRPQKRRKFAHEHSAKLTSSTNIGTSITTLRKKVRDLERLLAHQTKLPADVRLHNERALEAFKYEMKLAKKSARNEKIDKKYQMVRFFERQKASRKLKQLQKQVAADSSPSKSLQNDLHATEVDLNYIIYFPKGEKYISLFKDPGEHTKVLEKRNKIREDVERQMVEGTLGKEIAVDFMDVDRGEGVAEKGKEKKSERMKQDGEGERKKEKKKKEGKGEEGVGNKKHKDNMEKVPVEEGGDDDDDDDDDGFFDF